MPACFRDQRIESDIILLLNKYPSIREDLGYLENLLRESTIPARRCQEFIPDWVWRAEVHIQAFEGELAFNRCSLVYESDRTICTLLLLFDNDVSTYQDMIGEIVTRRT